MATRIPPEGIDTVYHTMGAIQHIRCDHCGVAPGWPCRSNSSAPSCFLPDFAHIARRLAFYEQQDFLGEVTRKPIPEIAGGPKLIDIWKEEDPPKRAPEPRNDGLGDLL